MAKVELVKQIFKVQEQRALIYSEFNSGFKKSLTNEMSEQNWNDFLKQTTQKFSTLSMEMNAIESKSRESNIIDLADLIRTLQNNEKQKLLTSVEMQVLRRELQSLEILTLKLKEHESMHNDNNNSNSSHKHQHSVEDELEDINDSKSQLEDKKSTLQKQINEATNQINSILNDLKFELEDSE